MSGEGQNVEQIRIDLIIQGDRVRLLNNSRVMQLADSIEDQGLIHPITVRPEPDGTGYLLVSGGHRLAAFAELGREIIPAHVREFADDLAARLFEVRENLQRENLSALDRAMHLAAEKAIYEARNPETKHGGNRKGDQVANNANLIRKRRFTKEMADELGCGESDIQRAIRIANGITPELQAEIHGTALADNQAQLLKLIALPPEDLGPVVRTMKDRGVYKVDKARQLMAGQDEPPPLPAEEVWQRKMATLWADAKVSWRRRFLLSIDAQFIQSEDGAE